MTVRRYPVAALLVIVTVALVVVNGFAWWGDTFALWIDDAMQLSAGVGALVCGFLAARRVRGHQRWWRVLVATRMAGWSPRHCFWSFHPPIRGRRLAFASPAR